MKLNRVVKTLSKGKKEGYFKIKAKVLRLKTIIENELDELSNYGTMFSI
jgi:hypothetical protein